MKVVMIVPSLRELGPFIVAKNIYLNSSEDVEFFFISLRKNEKETLEDIKKIGIQYVEMNVSKFPRKIDYLNLRKIVYSIKPNIVHCHGFWPNIMSAQELEEYNLITTLHNNPKKDYYYNYGFFISRIMIKHEIEALRKFKKLVAISNYVKNIFEKMDKKLGEKIEVIHNGVEDYFLGKENIFDKENNINNKLKIISVGHLVKIKNTKTAIKGINYALSKGCDIEYTIIGDGKEKVKLENLVRKLDIKENISFIGNIERKEVFNHLNENEAFIFPSYSEGLGLAAIEAQMMGLPVIGSNIPAIKEIIMKNENGYLCSPNDYKDFGEKLIHIHNNKNILKELSLNSRNNYLNKFSVEIMSQEYVDLYKKIDNELGFHL